MGWACGTTRTAASTTSPSLPARAAAYASAVAGQWWSVATMIRAPLTGRACRG